MKRIVIILILIGAFLTGVVARPLLSRAYHRVAASIKYRLGHRVVVPDGDDFWTAPTNLVNAMTINYVGDLILLRDAVEYGRLPDGGYSFDNVFRWMLPYWKFDDLTFAVFEGPMAGPDRGYTTSDFDDWIPLYLNFPDQFGQAVARSGVDFVSTANNHLLDQGTNGVFRTLDKLDACNILHDGSYRSRAEHEAIKVIVVRGKKIAVLCYTYGSNYVPDDFFFNEETSYITRPLVALDSKFLKENVKIVERDLQMAQEKRPDAIVVMAHMGGQFLHSPDDSQCFWNDIFVRNGVDVVLGDHSHSTQPVEWKTAEDGHRTLVVNCPGNFVNSYAPHDGDASYMARLYLDEKSAKPIACGIVPLYGYGDKDGNFAAIPVYDALTNTQFMAELSRNDFRRLQDVCRIVGTTVLGKRVELANAQPEYIITPDSRVHRPVLNHSIVVTNEVLMSAKSICFVGDSITEGSKNYGVGWEEPLLPSFGRREIHKFAKGSMTSKWYAENSCVIADFKADVYVCAFGCNDIRYRNPSVCAMNDVAYVDNVNCLVGAIRRVNAQAVIVFIAPWMSLDYDKNWKGTIAEKDELYRRYTAALRLYCKENGCRFVDPNPYLRRELARVRSGEYMVDYIHPGSALGCLLYSRAVLDSRWE